MQSSLSDTSSGGDRSPEVLQRAQAMRWLQAEHALRLRERAAASGLGEELSRLSDHEVLQLWSADQPPWGRPGQCQAVPLRLGPKPLPAAALVRSLQQASVQATHCVEDGLQQAGLPA